MPSCAIATDSKYIFSALLRIVCDLGNFKQVTTWNNSPNGLLSTGLLEAGFEASRQENWGYKGRLPGILIKVLAPEAIVLPSITKIGAWDLRMLFSDAI